MAEARESIGKTEIPPNWNFPERNNPNFILTGFNQKQRFLAGKLGRERSDYFFDIHGSPLLERHFGNPNIKPLIVDWGENSVVNYSFSVSKDLGSLGGRMFRRNEVNTALTIECNFLFGRGQMQERADSVSFLSRGELQKILLSDISVEDGMPIQAPPIIAHLGRNKSGFEAEDWDFSCNAVNFKLIAQSVNSTTLRSPTGEDFIVVVKVEEDKVNYKTVRVLRVSETHVPSGSIKVVEAPLSVDIEAIKNVAFSTQSEKEAPWRNIGQLIGVRVYYTRQQKA